MSAEKKVTSENKKNNNVVDVFASNAGGPPQPPHTGAGGPPQQRKISQAELQQIMAQQQREQAIAARQKIQPSVEFSRIGDQILVRKEITANEEVETKFDFYTQMVSKKTTLFLGGAPQMQLHPDTPFSKYAVSHVLERIRKDLIDMGGAPNPLRKTKAEFASDKDQAEDRRAGFKFKTPGK